MKQGLILEIVAVLVVTAVAAGLRFYGLDIAPPGLYHDEGINGVLGYYIIHGNRSLFFGEREGLFMYLLAEALKALGPADTSLRVVPALIGTATVPALYGLARLLYGPRVALLAACGLAASYWHVSISRTVFRAITLPFFEVVAFLLLWVALRRRRPLPRLTLLTAAGMALGLVMYTYIAGRVVPLVAIAFLATQLIADRGSLRPVWAGLPLYLGAAAVVFAPLGLFYWENPTVFLGRMEEVAVGAGTAPAGLAGYWDNFWRVAGMFFLAGDANWRHNLPGRPVFDPLFAAAFLLGLGLCLRAWRRAESRLLLLWLPATLLPTFAAGEAPHFLRAIGAIPPLYVLTGLGFDRLLAWLETRLRALSSRAFFAAAGTALLLVPAAITAYTYFGVWLASPEAFAAFDGPLAAAGRYLAASPAWQASAAGRRDFYLSTKFWQDRTTMLFYLWPSLSGFDRDSIGGTRLGSPWFDEATALPLKAGGARYLVRGEQAWAAAALRRLYGPDRVAAVQPVADVAGNPAFAILEVAGAPPPAGAAIADFGGVLTLVDYQLPADVAAGTELEVITRWQLGPAPASWRRADQAPSVFVHLLDADGSLLAAADGLGYHPVDWSTGEALLLRHTLHLPPGMAPGRYALLVGVVGPDGNRLSTTVSGRQETAVPLGNGLEVVRPAAAQTPPTLPLLSQLRLHDQLALLGLDFPGGATAAPGQTLKVALYWRALADVAADYDLTLTLVGDDGQEVARTGGRPAFGRLPTNLWRQGDLIRDPRALTIGARARGGAYTLNLTANEPTTGASWGPFAIGQVQVQEIPRSFAPPAAARQLPMPAVFGQLAALAGYDLDANNARPGGKLRLTLYWRCLAEGEKRYKVFTHLLTPEGSVAAQSDAEPAGGARPLSGWLAGEVVADEHEILLPPTLASGSYGLEVGLYDPADGSRLPLLDAAGRPTDTRLLLPPVAVAK